VVIENEEEGESYKVNAINNYEKTIVMSSLQVGFLNNNNIRVLLQLPGNNRF